MAEWLCNACGKHVCREFSDDEPTACSNEAEVYDSPHWWRVSELPCAVAEVASPANQLAEDLPCIVAEVVAPANSFADKVHEILDGIGNMLIEKNRKYGNAALEPARIFAKSDSLEQIRVRIDDKLNRIKNRQNDEDEDVINDLIGYLVLYKIKVKEQC